MNDSSFHAGFVAVMGRPNVGKSTLINALMGQKIAAVTPRPQTTRQKQLGILTTDQAQIIFIDTPGLHMPHHKLGQFMNQEAAASLEDGDLILFLVDASQTPPHEEDLILVGLLEEVKQPPPVFLVLNKIDRISEDEMDERITTYQQLLPTAQVFPISAASGKGLGELLDGVVAILPVGDYFYPKDQITDILLKKGWALDHLERAFAELKKSPEKIIETKKPEKKFFDLEFNRRKITMMVIGFIGIFLILSFTILVFFYMNAIIDYEVTTESGEIIERTCLKEDCSDMREHAMDEAKGKLSFALPVSAGAAAAIVFSYNLVPFKTIFLWVLNLVYLAFVGLIAYMWILFTQSK